jgi:patatin-like phospholipase/acyl hydrolase
MASRFRILSIDGGGIRGIIPGSVLAALEERAGRPVSKLFDMLVGTSTGGLLALALAKPAPAPATTAPHWTAAKLLELYDRQGPVIFRRSILDQLRSGWGLLDEKYPSRGLDSVLSEEFGETMLSEALVDVIVTSYDLEGRNPYFFKRRKARETPTEDDFPMWQAARATAAAPTYFEPLKVEIGGRTRRYGLVDGGVFANNPAMCGYAEAARFQRDHDLVLLSLGTGQRSDPIPYEKAKDWGLVNWPRPLLDVVFDGVSDATDYQLTQVMDDGRYFRLQTLLEEASGALDDASEPNLRALRREGERLVARAERDGVFERLMPLLL